jgi:hypothetical protein
MTELLRALSAPVQRFAAVSFASRPASATKS